MKLGMRITFGREGRDVDDLLASIFEARSEMRFSNAASMLARLRERNAGRSIVEVHADVLKDFETLQRSTTMKRSDNAPEPVGLLGARKLRKDEIKPELAAPMPAPGIDPSKYIIIDAQGRLSTNNPRKVGSDEPGDPAAWQWGEVRCWHTAPLSKG